MSDKSFEVLMKDLEELVSALESGDIELEQALEKYKKGIGIIQTLGKKLDDAKKQIETAGQTEAD